MQKQNISRVSRRTHAGLDDAIAIDVNTKLKNKQAKQQTSETRRSFIVYHRLKNNGNLGYHPCRWKDLRPASKFQPQTKKNGSINGIDNGNSTNHNTNIDTNTKTMATTTHIEHVDLSGGRGIIPRRLSLHASLWLVVEQLVPVQIAEKSTRVANHKRTTNVSCTGHPARAAFFICL